MNRVWWPWERKWSDTFDPKTISTVIQLFLHLRPMNPDRPRPSVWYRVEEVL